MRILPTHQSNVASYVTDQTEIKTPSDGFNPMMTRIAFLVISFTTLQSISAFILAKNVRVVPKDFSNTLFAGKEHHGNEIDSLTNGSLDRRKFVTRCVSLGITSATYFASRAEAKATSGETTTVQ